MPRHDVAIYFPDACGFYDAAADRVDGGAGRQTFLLARELAAAGLRVAHVVDPVRSPRTDVVSAVTLVQQPAQRRHGSVAAFAEQTRKVWSALAEADAAVTVFRGASGSLGPGAAWARAHRRRVVFAGANDSDFREGPFDSPRDPRAIVYSAGLRLASAIVVQSDDQATLARERLPSSHPRRIASFVEPQPASDAPGEAFLWVSRIAEYKRPMAYLELAAAVPEATFWMIPAPPEFAADQPRHDALHARAAELPNVELLPQRSHAELQALIGRAIAMVNTSSFEGVPNTWLEGWSRGVPALTLSFDPDGRIARNGLGIAAGGDWDAFVAGARRLWAARADRAGLGPAVRDYVAEAHGARVLDAWLEVVGRSAG